MANNVLIKIEQENKTEAEFMSRSFVDKSIKNRAYVNALGAELVSKYLSENGVEFNELHNMHSISKVLERVDLADILLPNIHIDARVIFDEDKIFIPKSHFELNIQPDIYVVVKLNDNFESVEIMGYVESDKVDFKKSNEEYYFIEKDALNSVDSLINYVKNFDSNREKSLDEEQMLQAREMSVSMADHDISDSDFKELLSMLLRSDSLRNSLLEFDNFELLSYNAVAFLPDMNQEPSQDTSDSPVEAIITEDAETIKDFEEDFKTFSEDDDMNEISESIENDIDSDVEEVSYNEEIDKDVLNVGTDLNDSSNDNSDSNIGGILATGAGIAGGAAAFTAGAAGAAGIAGAAAEGAAISAAANTASAVSSAAADALKMSGAATNEAMELAGISGSAEESIELPEENFEPIEMDEVDTSLIEDNIELPEEELPSVGIDEKANVISDDIVSNSDENIEISEEVFDADDTIAGISDDFGISVEGQELPEESENLDFISEDVENMDTIELSETNFENDENGYDDDIFAQFVQESEEQDNKNSGVNAYQDNMTSFADLEQMNKVSVSTPEGMEEISEPVEELKAVSNSTVISDKNFQIGEIPIDINASQMQEPIQEELEDIYNPDYSANNDSMLNNNVRIVKNNPNNGSSVMKILGGLIALVVIVVIGISASKFMKPSVEKEPIVDNYAPEDTHENLPEDPNTLQVDQNKIVEMNKKSTAVSNSVPAQTAVRQSKPISPTSYINVSKISWEVPDYVSYSPEFRQYFQSAGRSLKLALTSDLLLSTEYAYSNQVKVSVSFDRSGTFKDSRIVQSSGSSQVDKIVLQTVNQTLNVLKSPASLRDDENTTVILKIYF